MDDSEGTSPIVAALLRELAAQGHGGIVGTSRAMLTSYPIKGTIDIMALAEAVETAFGSVNLDEDGKTPAELNAANDG